MKSFKEYTMPLGHYRPIAKIGNMKSPEPRPTYAVNANAKGILTLGTMNPATLLAKKIKKFKKEDQKRIPRKPGQKLIQSDKHSDLYTDENPKGTIHGLTFTDGAKNKTISK